MNAATDEPRGGAASERSRPRGPAYVQRPGGRVDAERPAIQRGTLPGDQLTRTEKLSLLGIDWDWSGVDLTVIGGRNDSSMVERSLARFRANLAVIIWDAARLEGNNFTLPEVQTLLDGVTVEGKKIEDQQQVLALNEAYRQ